MKRFGLTGNIGCGKSTVATLLSTYPDVVSIYCDQIAKDIISNPNYQNDISTVLGSNVFPNGKADRKLMGAIVFGQPEKRKALEDLLHPIVWDIVDAKIAAVNTAHIYIVESAIIFETKIESKFDAIIVATCNSQEQFRRLRENREMTDIDIKKRLASQLSSTEKERRAQFVIHTDCERNELNKRVDHLYQELKQQKDTLG